MKETQLQGMLPMETTKVKFGKLYEVESKIQNETRSIIVSLPKGYEETKIRYPVLFILNASWEMNFIKNASAVHYLYGSGISPNMIVVGICDTAYARDFLPHLGNADGFVKFLKEELIPYIDKSFRTTTFKILYGQSNAGLLATYVLLTEPETFDAYIASSPMYGWDEEFVTKHVKSFFQKKLKKKKYFYYNYGTKDFDRVVNSIPNFAKLLEDQNDSNLIWKLDVLENEGHVPFISLYNALKFIFPDYSLSDEKIKEFDFNQLEAYYKDLSKRYGCELEIPSSMLFEFAFKFMPEKDYDKVIEVLLKYTEIYPYSDSVYMRLGQIYYLKGEIEKSKKALLKADELNPLSKVAHNTMKLYEQRIKEEQEKKEETHQRKKVEF